jgi:hypothetical protein
MKLISLTQGLFAKISDEDFEIISKYKWKAHKSRGITYAYSGDSRIFGSMHNFILSGAAEVDHKNRDGLDNQRENIRPCTHKQNMYNQGPKKSNSTGFKGVSQDSKGKFISMIRTDSGRLYLGYYNTAIEAAVAYDKAAKQHHGDFAHLNFP